MRVDLIPKKVRGKLLGRLAAFLSLSAIWGPVLSKSLYDAYKVPAFEVPWLDNFVVEGAGIPFFVSSAVGLFSLFLLLAFFEEPRRELSRNLGMPSRLIAREGIAIEPGQEAAEDDTCRRRSARKDDDNCASVVQILLCPRRNR